MYNMCNCRLVSVTHQIRHPSTTLIMIKHASRRLSDTPIPGTFKHNMLLIVNHPIFRRLIGSFKSTACMPFNTLNDIHELCNLFLMLTRHNLGTAIQSRSSTPTHMHSIRSQLLFNRDNFPICTRWVIRQLAMMQAVVCTSCW